MPNGYLIKNAEVVNEGKRFHADVLVKDGVISEIFDTPQEISPSFFAENNIHIVDVAGMMLLPGVIDDQVHFRDPGLTHKGDIYSESRAAVAGGITSFMEMPNTNPQTITNELLEQKYHIASKNSVANFSFYLGATNDNIDEIRKFDPSKNAGIKVFMGASTGNMLVDNPESLRNIFSTPFLIAIHSEDETIIQQNLAIFKLQYGEDIPIRFHPKIRSREACLVSTRKACNLANELNTRLHVLHISTADELAFFSNSIPLLQKRITAEVCVHHLWFQDDDYAKKGSLIKWNPSIKSAADREALFNAMSDGIIDIVATDHAPHVMAEKQQLYTKSPSGGPLVQHSLLAMLEFVNQKKISIEHLVDVMCHKPAICFKVSNRGFIRKNYAADMVLVNLNKKTPVTTESLLYKCKWSPFEGEVFNSKIEATWVNGNMVFDGEKVMDTFVGKRLQFYM